MSNPTAGFTSHLPTWIADLTLLAIALGAVCANALNVYSGSMSFLALGIRLPLSLRRGIVAIVFGVAGFFLALSGLHNAGEEYTDFLLIISYWIGPWLGVFFMDQFLRRGKRVDGYLFDRKHNPWGGAVAMAVAIAVSICLFSDQIKSRASWRGTPARSATSRSRSASCSPPCCTGCSSGSSGTVARRSWSSRRPTVGAPVDPGSGITGVGRRGGCPASTA